MSKDSVAQRLWHPHAAGFARLALRDARHGLNLRGSEGKHITDAQARDEHNASYQSVLWHQQIADQLKLAIEHYARSYGITPRLTILKLSNRSKGRLRAGVQLVAFGFFIVFGKTMKKGEGLCPSPYTGISNSSSSSTTKGSLPAASRNAP